MHTHTHSQLHGALNATLTSTYKSTQLTTGSHGNGNIVLQLYFSGPRFFFFFFFLAFAPKKTLKARNKNTLPTRLLRSNNVSVFHRH